MAQPLGDQCRDKGNCWNYKITQLDNNFNDVVKSDMVAAKTKKEVLALARRRLVSFERKVLCEQDTSLVHGMNQRLCHSAGF